VDFNSILIGTDDVGRLEAYYRKLFGDPTWSDDNGGGYVGWQIGSGSITIGPHSEVHGSNNEPGRIIWNIETHDVKGDFDRLVNLGAIAVRAPYDFEGVPDVWVATLADPDGNYFQLVSPMDSPSG
jgi:predicted enzyme related to lactoylglutathione lyase